MDPHSASPCPGCGKVGTKLVNADATFPLKVHFELSWESRREFWKRNRALQAFLILLIVAGAGSGLVFSPEVGFWVSLVIGFVGYFLGPYAIIKEREIRQGNS